MREHHIGRAFYVASPSSEGEGKPPAGELDPGAEDAAELEPRSPGKKRAISTSKDSSKARKLMRAQTEDGAELPTIPKSVSAAMVAGLVFLMLFYLVSAIFMAADYYSSPSIVMMSRDTRGNRFVIDDFREAYTWMRMNTEPNAKIASWWGA